MPGRLVDAARLGLDDPVLDLVGHAEAVPAADRVGLQHQGDRVGEPLAVDRHRPAAPRSATVTSSVAISHRRVPVRHAHDRLDGLERTRRGARASWPRGWRPRCWRRWSTPSRPSRGRAARARRATRSSRRGRPARRRSRRPATACRCAAAGWPAGRSGRTARCRCPCRSSRRPRCRRRRSCIARTSSVPVTARPSGVVLK